MCGWVSRGEAFEEFTAATVITALLEIYGGDISATTENGEGQGRAQAMGGGGSGAPSTEDKRPGRFRSCLS